MASEFVRFIRALCNQRTDDVAQNVYLSLDWPHSGEKQSLGAHAACLWATIHQWMPLAVE